MSTLQELINQGNQLLNEDLRSPSLVMWQGDVEAAIQPYGSVALDAYKTSVRIGVIRAGEGQKIVSERISRIQQLLRLLQTRDQVATKATADLLNNRSTEDLRKTLERQLKVTVNGGSVVIGDNGQISNLQMGDVVLALQAEIEKLPQSDEKISILMALREITENPTFASIAGVTVSAILTGIFSTK